MFSPTTKTVELAPHVYGHETVRYFDLRNVCPVCGQTHLLNHSISERRLGAWSRAMEAGAHIQGFWTELTPAQREEFFISGVCDACWGRLFPPEETVMK